jgi:hypothetical protein
MLNRNENEIMTAIYSLCDGTGSCLVSLSDIQSVLPIRKKFSFEYIDSVLQDLSMDGFFDLISSERKGEKMYVINLKESGFNYKRNGTQQKRDIVFRIFLAFIGAVATFIFGLILKAIF